MEKAVEDFRKEMAASAPAAPRSICSTAYGRRLRLADAAEPAGERQRARAAAHHRAALGSCQIGAIEKAIRSADLGLNPMNDGKTVRVPVPALTEDRRKDMVKHLHKVLEEHRTAVRNIRRDGNEAIKKAMKDKKITEDEERGAMDQMQKLTDDEIKKMEEMAKAKEKEVMQV